MTHPPSISSHLARVALAAGTALTLLLPLACGVGSIVGGSKDTAKPPAAELVKSEGPTSPIATKYVGKVVFSKASIERTVASDEAFATSFTLADEIHLRGFMAESIYNILAAKGLQYSRTYPHSSDRILYQVEVAGRKEAGTIALIKLKEEWIKEKTTLRIGGSLTGVSKTDKIVAGETSPVLRFASSVIPYLREGDNKLTVNMIVETSAKGHSGRLSETVASGSFTLKVAPGDVDRYYASNGPTLPLASHPQRAELEPKIRKLVESKWKNDEFIAASIVSKNWTVERHKKLGHRTQRLVWALIVVRRKGEENCQLFRNTFYQKYIGVDKYAEALTMGVGQASAFPCVQPAASEPATVADGEQAAASQEGEAAASQEGEAAATE